MWQVFIQTEAGLVKASTKCGTQAEAYRIGNRRYGDGMFTVMEVSSSVISNYRPPNVGL